MEVVGIIYLGLLIYPISLLFASAFVLTFIETGIVATLILKMCLGDSVCVCVSFLLFFFFECFVYANS